MLAYNFWYKYAMNDVKGLVQDLWYVKYTVYRLKSAITSKVYFGSLRTLYKSIGYELILVIKNSHKAMSSKVLIIGVSHGISMGETL